MNRYNCKKVGHFAKVCRWKTNKFSAALTSMATVTAELQGVLKITEKYLVNDPQKNPQTLPR